MVLKVKRARKLAMSFRVSIYMYLYNNRTECERDVLNEDRALYPSAKPPKSVIIGRVASSPLYLGHHPGRRLSIGSRKVTIRRLRRIPSSNCMHAYEGSSKDSSDAWATFALSASPENGRIKRNRFVRIAFLSKIVFPFWAVEWAMTYEIMSLNVCSSGNS
jgi:hypothetical protein